ncbi:MAG: hypothetical protein BGO38_00745 [Cellulomonas sp. 73-145]|uniref:hypothetical protein n=1 Tax=unclassified Cellulomonas TaxID=2620175 RepID=UPI0009293D7A|nr:MULTISPECIES: hypothetical protein [unclassified Cellulomonas]MBN9328529.1 hypothetical protein [Cellulomonas sp.]OJV60113.1 MAG: hypothetical protein BGO38_00745 [Cellulomonas sp. 73-145]BDO43540.1 hypothetical protein CELD12_30300 [Cellulomonas sp. NTE-D12]
MEPNNELPTTADWQLYISDAEIRVAKYEWLAARDGDDEVPAERVAILFEYYRALISLQAQQIADEFRAKRRIA